MTSAPVQKWIELGDASGARLKLAPINVQGVPTLHIFITGLAYTNPKWGQCMRDIGFNAPPSKKYLVRRVEPREKLLPSSFHKVFPAARLVEMKPEQYMLNLTSKASPAQQAEERTADVDMRGVVRLGRNEEGLEVFDSLSGRFFRDEKGERVAENPGIRPYLFLRLAGTDQPPPAGRALSQALARVAMGFVRAMDMGEVQHSEDYDAFRLAVFPNNAPPDMDELLSAAIDAALLRYVRDRNDVALEAYSPMARLYDYLPPYRGERRGDGVLPPPLSIAAQRLLGDTSEKTVLYPNAFDGAAFAFLPVGSQIRAYRGQEGVIDLSDFASVQDGVCWFGRYTAASEAGAGALFFNADPLEDAQGQRRDYVDAMQCLRSLAPGARAILALAADDSSAPGRLSLESSRFLTALAAKFSLEDVFETAPILTRKSGGSRGLRIFSLRNLAPADKPAQLVAVERYNAEGLPVLSSWDQVKAHVDETILRIDLKEAESQSIDLERAAANESYQRPYLAFSKVGEARTMVPANLQASSQAYMTRLESVYGPVDEFVQTQLGMGHRTLSASFSPEQVDGIAVMISRALAGRSSLLADDTGLGKGRQLAALATWANKRGENLIFVTDKANLFSDLARDLKHIGEWDRFRPMVLNSDGEITYEEAPGAEPTLLVKGMTSAAMSRVLEENLSLEELQVNAVFLSYSQIATDENAKALWLKNQLGNSLVIFDEAHVAAGSDSNIALQVSEIAMLAKHVQFASATWAKTHDNMHIYQRAFPASVSVGTLAETMRKGGDSFSEIFSTMLSAEGALVRREHDLSKLEVEMVIDTQNQRRNEDVSDKVADVLGSASFISGDMQQVFIRANSQSVARLRGAREVRAGSIKAKLFNSSFGAGSVIYQVMKSVQGALNATHVADLAIDSVAKGMKPVIVSDATGESLVEALLQDMIKLTPDGQRPEHLRIPTLRDMLRHVIYKRLATVRTEIVTSLDVAEDDEDLANELAANAAQALDATGIEAAGDADVADAQAAVAPPVPVASEDGVDVHRIFTAVQEPAQAEAATDPDTEQTQAEDGTDSTKPKAKAKRKRVFVDQLISDLPEMPQEAKERYATGLKELEDKINAVPDMPVIAFDVMAQRLRDAGISVGEMSGRKNSLVRDPAMPDGMWRLVPRAKSKKAVKATIRSFNNGTTQAVIINRSVAAGVSMHASPQFLDQSRRHMIEHQIPEDPVIRVQLLGRVNRYDQLSTPLITTASTGIYGEVRYLMMQNRKLARMSANVRSSRDNAMSLKGVTDLFNIVGRQAVQGFLNDNPLILKRLGITEAEVEIHPDLVNKLTMRIPLLRVMEQQVVYSELYSRVDEILLRAELDGENPLRPNELDIRAKTDSEIVFFGDDSPPDEFTSAFDAPVVARLIKWEQERNPLSYVAVREASRVNTERLIESGYLLPCGPDEQPRVNPGILKKVIDGYNSITRLAHLATDASSYDEAMMNNAPAKRAYIKYQWMRTHLKNMVPGARIGKIYQEELPEDGLQNFLQETVLTDLRPPEDMKDYLDPGKWKLTVVTSGDDRPQTYTLRSLLTSIGGTIIKGEVTGELRCNVWGSSFMPGVHAERTATLRNYFDMALRGKRRYEATVLTGNMYLAAEWAAATRQGASAIYTDDSGYRHRVIMMSKDAARVAPEYLPVRVADPDMLQNFLVKLSRPSDDAGAVPETFVLDTSFKSALAGMGANSGASSHSKRDSVMAIEPGQCIALSCSPKDVRRIKAALSAGQTRMRKLQLGSESTAAQDPSHVVIRTHSTKKDIARLPENIQRSMRLAETTASTANIFSVGVQHTEKAAKASVLSMEISSPDKAARAIELLRNSSGLEVYASTRVTKEHARDAIREVLSARRAEVRRVQEQLRLEINQGAQPLATTVTDQTDAAGQTDAAEPIESCS